VFLLDTNEINQHVSRQAENTAKVPPYQYLTKLNGEDNIISGLIVRSLQFPLQKIPTMSSILDKPGNGWEDINEGEYFKCSEGQREDVIMSMSKDFDECYFINSRMKSMRVTNVRKNKKNERIFKRRFKNRCAIETFQVNNESIQARHRNLFKNDYFDFYLMRDLIISMPSNSVNGLTPGKWTNLNKKWLNSIHQTLKQASFSILEVKFSRSIMRNNISGNSTQFINPAEHHIYLVMLNNKERTNFYVNYTQIHNIVGKEEWMKGEIKYEQPKE
jgi:hypothetical protein